MSKSGLKQFKRKNMKKVILHGIKVVVIFVILIIALLAI